MSWRRCSSCRAEIDFEATYWECSVSTCTRPRTGFFFCSVGCWESHLPTMNHREAWAVEKRAPSQAEWARREEASERDEVRERRPPAAEVEPRRRVVAPPPEPAGASSAVLSGAALSEVRDDEVLIVVSKLKKYVRARSGMNTSDNVMEVLSEHLRHLCDLAIRKAAEEGRKTVLDRDVRAILR